MDGLTLHLPHHIKSRLLLLLLLLPSTSIVAISCLLCMDFDCTQRGGGGGYIQHWLHIVTYKLHTWVHQSGWKRKTGPQRICLSNLLSDHVSHFMSGHSFPPEAPQKNGFKASNSTLQCKLLTTVHYSHPINNVLSMFAHRDHFIWILNLCCWCWCQDVAPRQVIKHRPRSVLVLQITAFVLNIQLKSFWGFRMTLMNN